MIFFFTKLPLHNTRDFCLYTHMTAGKSGSGAASNRTRSAVCTRARCWDVRAWDRGVTMRWSYTAITALGIRYTLPIINTHTQSLTFYLQHPVKAGLHVIYVLLQLAHQLQSLENRLTARMATGHERKKGKVTYYIHGHFPFFTSRFMFSILIWLLTRWVQIWLTTRWKNKTAFKK